MQNARSVERLGRRRPGMCNAVEFRSRGCRRGGALTLLVAATTGCGRHDATVRTERTDSAGVEIVVSTGTDRILDWRFERLFTLGGTDAGPESFYRVDHRRVGADARGNLYVLDRQNARIVVFDSDGRFVRSMGDAGGGPGELQTPGSMSVSPEGAVAVFDFGKGSLVRFGPAGQVQDQVPFPLYPTPNRQRHFSQFGDTTIVSSSTSPMDPGPLTQMLRRIVGPDTVMLTRLRVPPVRMVRFDRCGVTVPAQPIFAPELSWSGRGGTVVFASTAEYAVSLVRAGTLRRAMRRAIDPEPASRKRAIEHLGDDFSFSVGGSPCVTDPGEWVDQTGYAETIPLIDRVVLGPSDELWVRRFAIGTGAAAPIDVFDASGAYQGTLTGVAFSPVMLLPDDRVGGVETDQQDVNRLAVYAIGR